MNRVVLTFLVAVALIFAGSSIASHSNVDHASAHPGLVNCNFASLDGNVFDVAYDWLAVTTCSSEANLVSVASWLQRWVWDASSPYLGYWALVTSLPTGVDTRAFSSVAQVSGAFLIPSYLGINCVRTVAFHAATHGNTVVAVSDTGFGQCF